MKNYLVALFKVLILLTLAISYHSCKRWNENIIKIERFNYLDDHYSGSDTKDSLLVEAYLIHGYHKKFDEKIQEITDRYVCDSIIPDNRFYRKRFITFFRKTENTNRDNFQVRPKNKNIYARTNDRLYSYRIKERNSTVDRIRKIYHSPLYGDEISFQDFYCDKE
jgi:hypothetical protein